MYLSFIYISSLAILLGPAFKACLVLGVNKIDLCVVGVIRFHSDKIF